MIKKITRPLVTFGLTFALLIIPFALEGLFPFGNRQIMIIDSWHQYYPILQQLHDKLVHGKTLFYTWQSGGGTNFWLMMTYYAMSPLNLLSIFVDKINLREFLFFITLVKISLGGAFFTIYLQSIHRRYDMSTVFFGLLYAFCGFFMGYYWNVMWLDVVAVFPLVILGLHQLIFQHRIALYTIALSYAIISNYYVAFFVCFFIALYSFVCVFGEGDFGFKRGMGRILAVVAASLLAVGISGIVLLPVIKGMAQAYGLSSHDPTGYAIYTTLFDTLNRLLPFATPSVVDGLPNLSLGTMGTLLFGLYFLQPNNDVKQKVGYGLLFTFLIFSTNINYLNFIWHGLHFPNQVPFRFAFTISFLMLSVAYKSYLSLAQTSPKMYYKYVTGIVVYLIIAEKMVDSDLFSNAIYGTIALLVVYSAILSLYFRRRVDRRLLAQLIVLVLVVELVAIGGIAIGEAHSSGRDNYFASGDKVQKALDYWRAEVSEVSRIELSPLYSANDPLLYQYRGISQFSSTANAKYTTFTKLFGLSSNEPSNSYKFVPNTPIANGFLGVNYIISKDQKLPIDNIAYESIYQDETLHLLKSRYALPFAFAVERGIYLNVVDDYSPFVRQQSWLDHATGMTSTIFKPLPVNESSFDNLRLDTLNTIRYYYSNVDPNKTGHAKLVFEAPGDQQIYLYFKNQNKKVTLEYAGNSHQFDPRRGVVMDVGVLEGGTRIAVSFDVDAQDSGYFDLQAVLFDEAAYQVAHRRLLQSPLQIENFSDAYIRGNIEMAKDGVLYTSVPYDGGWHVVVDGEYREIVPLKEAVMTLPLTAGYHELTFYYLPPGFESGLMVSLFSVNLFIGLLAFMVLYDRKRRSVLLNRLIALPGVVQAAEQQAAEQQAAEWQSAERRAAEQRSESADDLAELADRVDDGAIDYDVPQLDDDEVTELMDDILKDVDGPKR